MILSVRSNNSSFKTVEFDKGFNVIVADRINDSKNARMKSRNGAGKSTLVEIIHFCLGAQVGKKSLFKNPNLKGWSFIIDIEVDNEIYSFERMIDSPSKIYVLKGNIDKIGEDYKYDKKRHNYFFKVLIFNKYMLQVVYGLLPTENNIYYPSFRELISYSIRRGVDGFTNPFDFFGRQKTHSRQSCNAFFLNLNIDYASEFQMIKDKKKGIDNYKSAAKSGVLGDLNLNMGELSTEVISRQKETDELKQQLDNFNVLPQYREISQEVNSYTNQMHELTNELVTLERLINRYEVSTEIEDVDISIEDIKIVYEEAGVLFGDRVNKSLDEVMQFHNKIIVNRKQYLFEELARLRRLVSEKKYNIQLIDEKRAESMKILETHGALEEYVLLQDRYATAKTLLEDAKKRLDSIQYIEDSKSRLKIENEELLIKSRQDYNERISLREKAISLFKKNTEFLYPHAGTLTIDLKETGYDFNVEIKNSRSQGVGYMKVFCYDMVISELGREKNTFPDFLIHDSTIFDGVDERQVYRALMLAKMKSEELGLQYITLINSDMIPYNEFDEEFAVEFDKSIVLRISDEQEAGGLLGIRF
jgi:uncharacterized protein YydD (DUF2326 family)